MSNIKHYLSRSCLCGLLLAASLNSYSQITLNAKSASVKSVIHQIENQSDYRFFFEDGLPGLSKKVSINAKDQSITQVMDAICRQAGIGYTIKGDNQVVVHASKAVTASAQQSAPRKIKGVVNDPTGMPIIGANIRIKGTSIGTISDIDGNFTLDVDGNAQLLEVSYIGYKTQDIPLKGKKEFKIVLKEDTETLDEVVVVGYGTTSKRKTTAAITSVSAEEIAKVPVADVTQSLAGRAPGLIVTQSGGGVGTTSSISIRGGGTPLFVIDDIVSESRDFENLNPEDIEQLTILKDASATAVYGARAANGIVMVVTKQGKAGKMNVNYNFNYNFSQPTYLPEKVGSYDMLNYQNIAQRNDRMEPTTSAEDLQKYRDGSDPYNFPNTDWRELCLRDFSPEQRHNLSISGGSENIKVYTGLGYYDQESIYRTNAHNMQRYNFRNNIVATFKEIGLKVTSGIDAYIWKMKQPATHQGNGMWVVWSHLAMMKPSQLAYNKDGQIFSGTIDSPLIDLSSDGGYYRQERTSVRGNLGLEWDIPHIPGLKLKALGNYTIVNDRDKTWTKTPYAYDLEGNPNTPGKPNLSKNTYYHNNFTTQFFADYNQTFNSLHTVGATFGIEASGSDIDNNFLSRQEYLLDIDQINFGPVSTAKNSSIEQVGYRRAALIGRLKYDYAAKYMVEGSMRYDGSDYFPKDSRWGVFFSGSAAWMISEEHFWKPLKERHIFDSFKLRASYGEIGLDGSTDGRLGRYEYMPSYNYSERGGYIGGVFMPGFSEGGLVATDITWYTSKNANVGFDFSSLNNRLSGTVEYFRMSTTGYLASPSNVGYTAPLGVSLPKVKSNGESIRQGVETWLQYKDK